jgi:hypothetical protein
LVCVEVLSANRKNRILPCVCCNGHSPQSPVARTPCASWQKPTPSKKFCYVKSKVRPDQKGKHDQTQDYPDGRSQELRNLYRKTNENDDSQPPDYLGGEIERIIKLIIAANARGVSTLLHTLSARLLRLSGPSSFRGLRRFHQFPDNRKNREHCIQIRNGERDNHDSGNPVGSPGNR